MPKLFSTTANGLFAVATLAAGIFSIQDLSAQPVAVPSSGKTVANLRVAKDFKVDLIYTVPQETQGSWVSLCSDPKGRLIVSDQYGKLFRLTLNGTNPPKIESIDLEIGCAQGLLYAFDSLYVMVNDNRYQGKGLYRVRDTNNDDQFDEVKQLRKLEGGGGEHGPHALLLSPDKKSIFVVAGNQTPLTTIDSSRVPLNWSEDHLIPRLWDGNGFMKGVLAPGGWIARTDPEGAKWELISTGFRNQYDAAFNHEGELFTYDADMEWDLNTPWYRPTRVNHVISGSEFGWRSGAGKYPAYYLDSFGSVVNVGPGSPTGVVFGYGAKFPAKYQESLFICDWSFGKMYAVHFKPSGATYTATLEEFVTGQPLALTDLIINPNDGAMYFAVGGRRTESALYRVTYTGNESTAPARPDVSSASARAKRRHLETYHGGVVVAPMKEIWPYLGDKDRSLRFAARIALEWQNVSDWEQKALDEKNPRRSIAALAALARVSSKDQFHRKPTDKSPDTQLQSRILASLDRIDWKKLENEDRLDLLRAYSLAFTRLGPPDETARQTLIKKFDPLFPDHMRELNAELAPMLVYLESPSAASKLVQALKSSPTQEEQIDLARALRVLKTGWTAPLRETYFQWFLRAANFKGGSSLNNFLRDIKNDAVANLSENEKAALKTILETKPQKISPMENLKQRQVVKEWTMSELAPSVEKGLRSKRDFDRGRQIFGESGCAACHRFQGEGASVGPDLTNLGGRFSSKDLLESILDPNKEISDQYGAITITKKNGDVITGRVGNLNGDHLQVIENMFAPNDFTVVSRKDVESIQPSRLSPMPSGLVNSFTEEEIQDLTAYLLSLGDRKHRYFR